VNGENESLRPDVLLLKWKKWWNQVTSSHLFMTCKSCEVLAPRIKERWGVALRNLVEKWVTREIEREGVNHLVLTKYTIVTLVY
jgi:hypothetical protein